MSVFKLDPEVYKRYKDEVLKLCNSFQKIDQPGLSDQQANVEGLFDGATQELQRTRTRLELEKVTRI